LETNDPKVQGASKRGLSALKTSMFKLLKMSVAVPLTVPSSR
jgi:hypothetical protein